MREEMAEEWLKNNTNSGYATDRIIAGIAFRAGYDACEAKLKLATDALKQISTAKVPAWLHMRLAEQTLKELEK